MTSNIDITQPPEGNATTSGVRANFAAAKSEIEALQEAVAAPKTTVGNIASPSVSVTLTPGLDDLISFTATANSTIDIASAADGKSIILRITQDSTGGHSITPGTSIAQGCPAGQPVPQQIKPIIWRCVTTRPGRNGTCSPSTTDFKETRIQL